MHRHRFFILNFSIPKRFKPKLISICNRSTFRFLCRFFVFFHFVVCCRRLRCRSVIDWEPNERTNEENRWTICEIFSSFRFHFAQCYTAFVLSIVCRLSNLVWSLLYVCCRYNRIRIFSFNGQLALVCPLPNQDNPQHGTKTRHTCVKYYRPLFILLIFCFFVYLVSSCPAVFLRFSVNLTQSFVRFRCHLHVAKRYFKPLESGQTIPEIMWKQIFVLVHEIIHRKSNSFEKCSVQTTLEIIQIYGRKFSAHAKCFVFSLFAISIAVGCCLSAKIEFANSDTEKYRKNDVMTNHLTSHLFVSGFVIVRQNLIVVEIIATTIKSVSFSICSLDFILVFWLIHSSTEMEIFRSCLITQQLKIEFEKKRRDCIWHKSTDAFAFKTQSEAKKRL